VFATEIVLLSPCLHMLPSVRFPFSDGEQRYVLIYSFCGVTGADGGRRARMRYLDMLWNDKSREVLWQRSRAVRYIRECKSVLTTMRRVDC
jgi:lysyl-tRNA synthetase class 2